MRQHKRTLARLARRLDELDAQQDADDFAPIPYRLYELDDAGRRAYVEPNEDEVAMQTKFYELVHGRRW